MSFAASLVEDFVPVARARPAEPARRSRGSGGGSPEVRLAAGRGALAVVAREHSAKEELLALSESGAILHFHHDSRSPTGWRADEVHVPNAPTSEIARILAFFEAGVVNVLVHYVEEDAASAELAGTSLVVWMQSREPGLWSELDLDPELAAFFSAAERTGVLAAPDGRHFVYGTSRTPSEPTFFFTSRHAEGWRVDFSAPTSSPTAAYALLPAPRGRDLAVVRVDGGRVSSHGAVVRSTFAWAGTAVEAAPNAEGRPWGGIEEVIALPGRIGEVSCLLLDRAGQLVLVSGWSRPEARAAPLSGGHGQPPAVRSTAVGLDASARVVLFALDERGKLWVARQLGMDPTGAATFVPWVQLGHALVDLASPRVTDLGPVLFGVDDERRLVRLAQRVARDLAAGPWSTTRIEALGDDEDATPVPTYVGELTVLDEAGLPLGPTRVVLATDRAAMLVLDGAAHFTDPIHPITVTTDRTGHLTIAALADHVTAPALEIRLPGAADAAPRTFRLDSSTHARLAGRDPRFAVTGTSLRTAGIIDEHHGPATANAIAAMLRSLAEVMLALARAAGPGASTSGAWSRVEVPSFRLDLSGPSAVFEALCREDAEAFFRETSAMDTGPIARSFGDAAVQIASGVLGVEAVVVDARESAVRAAVGARGAARTFALSTVDDVALLVEILLIAVGPSPAEVPSRGRTSDPARSPSLASLERLLGWLRLELGWSELVQTERVLVHYLDSFLVNLSLSASPELADATRARLQALGRDVRAAFDEVSRALASASFHDLGQAKSNAARDALSGAPLSSMMERDLARARWVFSRARAWVGASGAEWLATVEAEGAAAAGEAGESGAPYGLLLERIEVLLATDQIEQAVARLDAFAHASIADGRQVLEVSVAELLGAARDLVLAVLEIADELVEVLLPALATAAWRLRASLDVAVSVPGISWPFEHYSGGDQLRLIDLLALVLATPATILHGNLSSRSGVSLVDAADAEAIVSSPVAWPHLGPHGGLVLVRPRNRTHGELTRDARAWMYATNALVASHLELLLDALAHAPEVFEGVERAASPLETFLSWSSIASQATALVLSLPERALETPPPLRSRVQDGAIVAWAARLAPLAADLAYAVLGPRRSSARSSDLMGVLMAGASGALALGAEVGRAAEQTRSLGTSPWTLAENLIGAIPGTSKCLLVTGTERGFRIVAGLTSVCHVGAGVAHLAAAQDLATEAAPHAGVDAEGAPLGSGAPRRAWQRAIAELSAFGA